MGPDSDRILSGTRVAIIGLGGGGSHIVQQLAHIGVGDFFVVDPDMAEISNLNRLVGATYDDILEKRPKVVISERVIRGVNPKAKVISFKRDWKDISEHLRDLDVIFGCVDTFKDRNELENYARRYMIPFIDIGMDVHKENGIFRITGQVILSLPGQPCMKCLGFLSEDKLALEAAKYGDTGGRPQVVWPNGILASIAVGIFMQLVTPWHSDHQQIVYLEYDGNEPFVRKSHRLKALDHIHCRHFTDPTNFGDPFWGD